MNIRRAGILAGPMRACAAALLVLFAGAAANAQSVERSDFSAGDKETAITPLPARSRLAIPEALDAREWRVNDAGQAVWAQKSSVQRMEQIANRKQTTHGRTRATSSRGARRLAAGFVLGFAGFFAGAIAGSAIEGDSCICDDPGLMGAIIGAPVGAAIGATIGVLMVR
jgi:hypothetical protein